MLISFTTLRQLANAIPAYLAERTGNESIPPLRAGAENELGIAGLDTESLLLEFAETYQVDLSSFDFTEFIGNEPVLDFSESLLDCLKGVYLLAAWLGKVAVVLLSWPFATAWARRIWQEPLKWFWLSPTQHPTARVLTIGDFVASAAVGRFVLREQVCFRLVR